MQERIQFPPVWAPLQGWALSMCCLTLWPSEQVSSALIQPQQSVCSLLPSCCIPVCICRS